MSSRTRKAEKVTAETARRVSRNQHPLRGSSVVRSGTLRDGNCPQIPAFSGGPAGPIRPLRT